MNDYSSGVTGRNDAQDHNSNGLVVSPTKTELARSVAQSTDKDMASSFAADETQAQHHEQLPQYSNTVEKAVRR